jgi:alkanesulfonate monooxygenase SsuD/methylene tetrahydromethanopterin reductase-like flavin-dependent oxidoreductase (luciferase family)
MHHPIRLAEDAATVDLLSNGRLDLGFGAAMIEEQGKAFNIDVKGFFSRAYEAAEVLQKCFTEREFTHEGKYFQFQNVRMTTKSVQKPHPPIFWASMGPKSLVEAAERNYGLASAMESPQWTLYMDKQRELGRRRPADFKVISGPIFGHVAENRERAWDDCEAGLHWIVEYYNKFGMNIPLAPLGQFRKPENAVIHGKPLAIGTPDQVLRILSAYRNEPMDELAIEFYHPGQDVESVKRSMRLFAKEVLAEVKRWSAP